MIKVKKEELQLYCGNEKNEKCGRLLFDEVLGEWVWNIDASREQYYSYGYDFLIELAEIINKLNKERRHE